MSDLEAKAKEIRAERQRQEMKEHGLTEDQYEILEMGRCTEFDAVETIVALHERAVKEGNFAVAAWLAHDVYGKARGLFGGDVRELLDRVNGPLKDWNLDSVEEWDAGGEAWRH